MRSTLIAFTLIATTALVALLGYGVLSKSQNQTASRSLANGERAVAPVVKLERLAEPQRENATASSSRKQDESSTSSSLADFRGKVVVLNIWASWCPSCVDELPLLQEIHKKIEKHDALVLGVATNDASEDSLKALTDAGATYPALRDPNGKLRALLRTSGYPATYVIDRKGRIAAIHMGPVTRDLLDETVKPVLKEKA